MPPAELLQFRIALALPIGKGLACLGWTQNPDACIECCTLFHDDGSSTQLQRSDGSLQLHHTAAPELDDGSQATGPGFVLWLTAAQLKRGLPMLTLNDQVAELERPHLLAPEELLNNERLLTTYGSTLLAMAQQQRATALQQQLNARLQQLRGERSHQLGRVDQTWLLQDTGMLLLTGRLACQPRQITRCILSAGKQHLDVTAQLLSSALPTAWASKSKPLQADACAFALLLPTSLLPNSASGKRPLQLQLETSNLASLNLPLQPLPGTLQDLDSMLAQAPTLAAALLTILQGSTKTPAQRMLLQQALHTHFIQQWTQAADSTTRFAQTCALSINAAVALEQQGLLVLGTFVRAASARYTLWLHAEGHAAQDVTGRLQFLPVFHELERLREHFPQASEQLYYILHAPLPTEGGERRALRLCMPGVPDLWLKVATPQPQLRGVDQVKALLAQIPHGDFLWRNFKTVCDAGLGQALHWLGRPPVARSTAAVEQFGTAPRKPAVSIIVPLYGRWDFMRHQLAQFCKDPEFAKVDLIYVVDDPGIHAAVLADASHYQPLFQIPFRVVTYAENRGFAGANNSAVPYARAPLLLLLNSDVLPQQAGWLQTLRRAYSRLPQCGMVGPLLQFPEGSIQHAGMAATRQSNNPGLVFSHHPGKGGAWDGGNTPSEQPLLTGACLLLSKQDYQAAGGLDEDYLVGDFEDSDFSLRMRALGKRLYLVPAARLWHLERQSQYLGNNATAVRDMLTLYNAWRYHNKIAAGALPDPEKPDTSGTRQEPRAVKRSKVRA